MSDKASLSSEGEPRLSSVLFHDELPIIAHCGDCEVLVPKTDVRFKKSKKFFKRPKSVEKLYSFGSCCVLLLEYKSGDDFVDFSADANQTPVVGLNLNQIINRSLKHNVRDSNVWQEFHLNDGGKKRSFVLKFQKSKEFDVFHGKLKEVISQLLSCSEGKLFVRKKYYLVGFRQELEQNPDLDIMFENNVYRGSSSSESSRDTSDEFDDSFLSAPFAPKPFKRTELSVQKREPDLSEEPVQIRSEQKPNEKKYRTEIFGSLEEPLSVSSLWKSFEETDDSFIDGNETFLPMQNCESQRKDFSTSDDSFIAGNETFLMMKTGESQYTDFSTNNSERGKRILGNIAELEETDNDMFVSFKDSVCTHTLNGIEIHRRRSRRKNEMDNTKSANILDIDFDEDEITSYDFVHSGNYEDIDNSLDTLAANSDENLDDTMKAEQKQNLFEKYAQLLQRAIYNGDQECARGYAEVLAASFVKLNITVDKNTIMGETRESEIE